MRRLELISTTLPPIGLRRSFMGAAHTLEASREVRVIAKSPNRTGEAECRVAIR